MYLENCIAKKKRVKNRGEKELNAEVMETLNLLQFQRQKKIENHAQAEMFVMSLF
jgi:hypothetical protein